SVLLPARDRPAHSGETGAAGPVNYKQAVVDNHVHIAVPPGQAALGVSQAAAERTEGQADAAGCGSECIRMCAAIEGRKRSGKCKAGVGAIEIGKTGIRFDTENPARARCLPIKSDLATAKSARTMNLVAENGRTERAIDGVKAHRGTRVDAGVKSCPTPERRRPYQRSHRDR